MRFTSPSRRALGLAAASTIGMSTALLGVTGIASAAVDGDSSYSRSSDEGDPNITIPNGFCFAYVQVEGAAGGGQDSSSAAGTSGDQVSFAMAVDAGDVFTFAPGTAGGADVNGSTNGAGGTNALAPSLNGTAGTAAGGGGAGAGLLFNGALIASAAGGAGAGAGGGAGGGVSSVASSVEVVYNEPDIDAGGATFSESNVVVTAIGCDAPYAPSIGSIDAADGEATVLFYDVEGDNFTADPSGYEYRVGNGSWTALTETDIDRGFFTITGLVNGTEYSITMRSISEYNGVSEASDPETVTPYAAPGAPTLTAVRTAPSQITVTWTPSAEEGPFPVAGYGVYWGQGVPAEADGQGGSGTGGDGCLTDASATSCTFFVPAGANYQVGVYSFDTEGNFSDASVRTGLTVPGVAAPTSVPTQDNGDIVGPAGPISKLTAGQKVTLQGSGYAPNSTVELYVFSSPVRLGTVVADQSGNFSVEVTVPANLANGTHHLVATGVDANGNVRNLVIAVTVSGGVATLATTGFDAVPVAVGGGLVLLTGAGLLVGARRRSNV